MKRKRCSFVLNNALLTRSSEVLQRYIREGFLDPEDFLSRGLVELLKYIGRHSEFISDGNFSSRDECYTNVLSYLDSEGFDVKYYQRLYKIFVERQARNSARSSKRVLSSRVIQRTMDSEGPQCWKRGRAVEIKYEMIPVLISK
ncbi:hypothetical protein J4218_06880 [Candidatus Pacearchaeota archaeon]|nr:hypothetical protein [Candidatus Pacearchaeota archaeon]